MKKINAGNLFAGMRSSSVIAGLFIVLIVSIVLLFANFAYLNTQSNHDKQYIGHAGELASCRSGSRRTPPKRRRARARRSSS